MAGISPHNIYKVNEYVAFLRKNGLVVNNLFSININTPICLNDFKLGKKEVDYIEGDDNGDISAAKGSMFSTKGTGVIKTTISTVTGKVSTGNSGGLRTKGYKWGQKALSGFFGKPTLRSTEMVELMCTSAQLPFHNTKIDKSFYNNYTHKFVTGVDTDAVQLTFYLDRENMYVVDFFTKWQDNMVGNVYNKNFGVVNYKADYGTEIVVTMINKSPNDLRKDGGAMGFEEGGLETLYGVILKGAFPNKIEPITVKSGATELIELKVSFEYDAIEFVVIPDKEKQSDLNLTGAKLNDLSIIDRKNMANQALSQAKDLANNIVYEAKTVVAQVHEVKKTIQATKDSVKNLPKAIKTELKDIKDEAKKAVRF